MSARALGIAVIALGEIALGEKPAPLGEVPRTLSVDPAQTAARALVAIRQAGTDLEAAVADPPGLLAEARARLGRVIRLAEAYEHAAGLNRGRRRRLIREAGIYAACAHRLRVALDSVSVTVDSGTGTG